MIFDDGRPTEPVVIRQHPGFPEEITRTEAALITSSTGMEFFRHIDAPDSPGGEPQSVMGYLAHRVGGSSGLVPRHLLSFLADAGVVAKVIVDGQERWVVRDHDVEEVVFFDVCVALVRQQQMTQDLRRDFDMMDRAATDPRIAEGFEVLHGHPPVTVQWTIDAARERQLPLHRSLGSIHKVLGRCLLASSAYAESCDPDRHHSATTQLLSALIRAELIIRVECTDTGQLFFADLSVPGSQDHDIRMQLQHDLVRQLLAEASGDA